MADQSGPGDLPPPPEEPSPAADSGGGGFSDRQTLSPSGGMGGYDRVPPHSLEAEVSVLGAALLSRVAAGDVVDALTPEDFYRSAHRIVFEAIQELMNKSEPVDPVTLLDHLVATDRLDQVGGAAAVQGLAAAVPTAANAAHYARIVSSHALMRRVIEAGTKIVQLGYEPTEDPRQAVNQAESVMYDVAEGRVKSEAEPLKGLLNEAFEEIERRHQSGDDVVGLPTGFRDLDHMTAGFQPQNLIVLAARPAMGKCGRGTTMCVDSTTGARRSLEEIVHAGRSDKPWHALALDEDQQLQSVEVSEFHHNGEQAIVRLETRLGRRFEATSNHPLLTPGGWVRIEDLEPGSLVAVPRSIDVEGSDRMAPAEVTLLAYLLGDGSFRSGTPELTTESPAIEEEAVAAAAAFGCATRSSPRPNTGARRILFRSAVWGTDSGAGMKQNHLTVWLRELGLWGHDGHSKFVPEPVFRLPNDQVALFLSRLFATDGSAWVAEAHGYFGISYTSVSRELIDGIVHLLLRLEIVARVRERSVKYVTPAGEVTRRPAHELEIRDAENVLRFLDRVGIFSKEEDCDRVRAAAEARTHRHTNTDLLPVEVWDDILVAKGDRSWADVSEATGRPRGHNWHVGKRRPSRRLLSELAEALDDDGLRAQATSDIYWDEVASIQDAGIDEVYDLTVPDLHNFVADDVIVHNSALMLSMAQYITAELKRPVAIFSLEMSKIEIVMRLLSSEAGVDSSRIKTGKLEDADWRKLGDALGKLADAPLYIDDTPSITMLEILSKCRRLKAKDGLDMVIVDYMQLMTSHKRVDNRQQEVAEISRGMKMLAKELDIPVIALSQLNRSPEMRTDKRPMLADLRESGCLTASTRIIRADTGQPVPIGDLVEAGVRDAMVWAEDAAGRLVPARMTHAFSSGVKEVHRVTLRSGRVVEATANHPFRTLGGWRPLGELGVGSFVAVARRLPEPTSPAAMDPDEIVLLAHLIGEGTVVARQALHYTSMDEANLEAVTKAAWNRFGIEARRTADGRSVTAQPSWGSSLTPLGGEIRNVDVRSSRQRFRTQLYLPSPHRLTRGVRNPIAAWLDELGGVWDRRSWQKRVPAAVFSLSDGQVRDFLHHLWSTDGTIALRREGSEGPRVQLSYATASQGLAHDVQLLLARLDLRSRVRTIKPKFGGRPQYRVEITGVAQQRRFLSLVGCHGARGDRVEPALAMLDAVATNTNIDAVPIEVWDQIRSRRQERGMTDRAWDEIVAIESRGEQPVFDATVAGLHNFVADGVILHNSVEQDADIVGFIYRDEVYDAESPDRGMAELIIAKHRNGATGTVKLAFLGHLTKFANLARGPAGGFSQGPGGSGGGPGGPPMAPPPMPPPPESPV